GYARAALADAWSRYLPPPSSPQECATSATGATQAPDGSSSAATDDDPSATSATADGGANPRRQAPLRDPVADGADVADLRDDEGEDDFSDDEPAAGGRECVECGCDLPVGWVDLYCERHGGERQCRNCGVRLTGVAVGNQCRDCARVFGTPKRGSS